MQSASRAYNDVVVNQPDKKRRSPHIWFFVAMLEDVEKILATKAREQIPPDQGKAEAVELLRKTQSRARSRKN